MRQADVDAILDRIRDHGGRVTSVTRRIVHIAVDNPYDHLRGSDFVEYANKIEPVTESTVYRVLDRLVGYAILERTQLGVGAPRYHLRPLNHVHLVCEVCGGITDAPAAILDGLEQRLHTDFGFGLDRGLSSLNGTCVRCR